MGIILQELNSLKMYIITLRYVVSGALAKLRKATVSLVISACPSVRPRGPNRLSLDGFSYNSYERTLTYLLTYSMEQGPS